MSTRTYKLGQQLEKIKSLLNEDVNSGVSQLVVIDVQPEYKSAFGFSVEDFCSVLNKLYSNDVPILILYNGEDTLGMISEYDYRTWLVDNGLDFEAGESIPMYDKGYAFFRYCMDEGIDEDQIVQLVQEMMANDINDSRDLDEEFWNNFVEHHGAEDIRELMEFSDDCINIPDLMDVLRNRVADGAHITGGGVQECFKEVEIALQALNKPYKVYTKFTY